MKTLTTTTIDSIKRTLLASATVALLATSALAFAPQANAGVFISVNFAPPVLPVYEQPAIPADGYLWTPGYWAYDNQDGYYWVAGMWVQAPYAGALWTPGYWGWSNGAYVFNEGYWSDHIGYYGGINYGYGYCGVGYQGGYWNRGGFVYNVAVNRIENVRITHIYNRTVINNITINRYSFNGPGGVTRRATAEELAVTRERHVEAVDAQIRQRSIAIHNEALRASANRDTRSIETTARAVEVERDVEREKATQQAEQRSEARSVSDRRTEQQSAARVAIAQRSQYVGSTYNGRAMPEAASTASRQPERQSMSYATTARMAPKVTEERRQADFTRTEVAPRNIAVRTAPARAVAAPRVEQRASRKV